MSKNNAKNIEIQQVNEEVIVPTLPTKKPPYKEAVVFNISEKGKKIIEEFKPAILSNVASIIL